VENCASTLDRIGYGTIDSYQRKKCNCDNNIFVGNDAAQLCIPVCMIDDKYRAVGRQSA
jgi:hypothetical protein